MTAVPEPLTPRTLLVCAFVLFTTIASGCGSASPDGETPGSGVLRDFSIIVLPDTQNYVRKPENAPLFTSQTRWIADQILKDGNPRNIAFVTHVGDIVSNGSDETQWQRAVASLDVLAGGLPEAVVPHSVLPGNHDFHSTGNKSTGNRNYVRHFGPDRFASYPWYGGADPSGSNSYQIFDGGGVAFLHIALEWRPSANVTDGPRRDPAPIAWAQSVLQAHPGMPTIISTHEHLDDDPPGPSPAANGLWHELIRCNDQIIMVLSGHYHSLPDSSNDGEFHQVRQNDFGHDVVEVLQDYQDYPHGGDGWLRIITFDAGGERIHVEAVATGDEIHFETYSPVLDQHQTETVAEVGPFASAFSIAMDFADRFEVAPPAAGPATVCRTVRVTGGLDKELRADGEDHHNAAAATMTVDADDGAPDDQPTQVLLKFDDLKGDGGTELPPAAAIASAALSLNVRQTGSGFSAHVVLTPWSDQTTWASLAGDGLTTGVEIAAAPIAKFGSGSSDGNVPAGILELDVTDAVRAWLRGEPNHGIALVPFVGGTDGLDIASFESTSPPILTLRILEPELVETRLTQGANGYTGVIDTQIESSAPDDSAGLTALVLNVDRDDPPKSASRNHLLIRFEDPFEQLPAEATIERATLSLWSPESGDGGTLHRLLIPWDADASWAGSFRGDGVQPDDAEAASAPDAFGAGVTGRVELDVTETVRAWSRAPHTNFGWVMLPAGNDGWKIATSEAASGERPTLVIVARPAG